MDDRRLKKWEIALICAAAVTLLWGFAVGQTPCYGWWGTIYPELADAGGSAEAAAAGAQGVALRFRLLEWLEAALTAFKYRL